MDLRTLLYTARLYFTFVERDREIHCRVIAKLDALCTAFAVW